MLYDHCLRSPHVSALCVILIVPLYTPPLPSRLPASPCHLSLLGTNNFTGPVPDVSAPSDLLVFLSLRSNSLQLPQEVPASTHTSPSSEWDRSVSGCLHHHRVSGTAV